MIHCPICKSPTSVTETRATPAGSRRRRVCDNVACGKKVTTYEVVSVEGMRMLAMDEPMMISRRHLDAIVKLIGGTLPFSLRDPGDPKCHA